MCTDKLHPDFIMTRNVTNCHKNKSKEYILYVAQGMFYSLLF